jgi:hypothetical protein
MKILRCAVLLLSFSIPLAASESRLEIVREFVVPHSGPAYDVRWAADGALFLTLGRGGVVRWDPADASSPPTVVVPGGRDGFDFASRLATAPAHLVVAAPFAALGVKGLARGTPLVQSPMDVTVDVDARGTTYVVLGALRGSDGKPQESIIWRGQFGTKSALAPVASGRGAGAAMARCHFLETGAVRFMLDGSFVAFPGVEPGVYRYGPHGKLLQTWESGPLGVLDSCTLDDRRSAELAADPARRYAWLNGYRTVDEILPLKEAAGIVIRSVDDAGTRWEMVRLGFGGRKSRVEIPLRSASPLAHLKGDVRGNEVVLLVSEYSLPGAEPARSRLYLGRLR